MIDQILPQYGYKSDNIFFYIINYKPPLTYLFDKFFSTNIKKDLSKNLKLTMIVLLVKKKWYNVILYLKTQNNENGRSLICLYLNSYIYNKLVDVTKNVIIPLLYFTT